MINFCHRVLCTDVITDLLMRFVFNNRKQEISFSFCTNNHDDSWLWLWVGVIFRSSGQFAVH